MAEFDRMFGNMSDEDYEAWKKMSPEEKKEVARSLALQKKQEKKKKEAANKAYWKNFRKVASEKGGESRGFFPELEITTNKNPLVTDYRGVKGTPESLEDISKIDAEGYAGDEPLQQDTYGPDSSYGKIAKAHADEILEDDDNELLKRSRIMPGVQEAIDKINYENRVITPTTKDPRVAEAKEDLKLTDYRGQRGTAESLSNIPELNVDAVETTYDEDGNLLTISEADKLLRQNLRGASTNLAKVSEEAAREGELRSPAHPVNQIVPEVEDDFSATEEHLAPVGERVDLMKDMEQQIKERKKKRDKQVEEGTLSKDAVKLKVTAAATLKAMGVPDSLIEKAFDLDEPVKVRPDEKVSPEVAEAIESGDLEKVIKTEKKEKEGLIDLGEDDVPSSENKAVKKKKKIVDNKLENALEVSKKKKGVTSDFVKYDENGYPVYKKLSKWGKSFNDAFAKAREQGKETFMWKAHDGTEREYSVEQADKTIKKAPTGELNDPSTMIPQLGGEELDPSVLMPQISKYKAAKTTKEAEEVIKEAEKAATTDEEKKNIRAEIKEQAIGPGKDKYWVDPLTGFALNLSAMDRRIDRADVMKLASLLPVGDRAAYLFSKKLIDKSDFDAMVKPTQKEELELKLRKLQIKEAQFKVITAKQKSIVDPKRKEWLTLYSNAVAHDDYEMQELLGKKLGFDADVLALSKRNRMAFEKSKLAGKKGADGFKNNFNLKWSTVINKKDDWIRRASSIMYKEGVFSEMGLDKEVYRDRRGYFRSFGLFEKKDMAGKSRNEIGNILAMSPFYENYAGDERFKGTDGVFDPKKFVNNTIEYEKYLMDNLVFKGMSKLYGEGQYAAMLRWVGQNTPSSTLDRSLSAQSSLNPNRAARL